MSMVPWHLIGRNSQWEAENPNFLIIWPTDKCEGSIWGWILPGIHWACQIFPSPLIGQNSQWLRKTPKMRVRGEGPRGLFLGRSYSSKCLAFPVFVGFRWLFHDDPRVNPWWLLDSQMTQKWPKMTPEWPPRTKRTQDDSRMRARGDLGHKKVLVIIYFPPEINQKIWEIRPKICEKMS